MNLQDAFINQIRTQRIRVTIDIVGSEPIEGLIRGFDPSVVVVDVGENTNIIYKHSISVIRPHEPLDLFNNNVREAENEANS
ncbi:MAG: RNA chaperone Hfq [Oscillospiraceae bacterium]